MDHRKRVATPLSKVTEGQRARIIAVEKYAPLKDPLEVIVKGFHVSLRVEEASEITVEIME